MNVPTFHCLFRVEAGPGIGLGHLSRCLALAVQLKKKGLECAFIMTEPGRDIRARVAAKGMEVIARNSETSVGSSEEAIGLARLAREAESGWLVVDGYGFHPGYFKLLRQNSSASILAIDDFQGSVEADLILNQNLALAPDLYEGSGSRLLLGPEFCLLDPDPDSKRQMKPSQDSKRILVTLGGADPAGLTIKVVDALSALNGFEVDVVVGPFNKDRFETLTMTRFNFHHDLPSLNPLIQKADLAVMSLGVTTWEMAWAGLPFVMLPVHPAQMPTAQWLERHGHASLGMELGRFEEDRFLSLIRGLLDDRDGLERQSSLLRQLVDGQGADRVAVEMEMIGGRAE